MNAISDSSWFNNTDTDFSPESSSRIEKRVELNFDSRYFNCLFMDRAIVILFVILVEDVLINICTIFGEK